MRRHLLALTVALAALTPLACSSPEGFCGDGGDLCPPEVRFGDEVYEAFCLDLPNVTLTPTGSLGQFHPATGGELIPVQQLTIEGVALVDAFAVQGPPAPELCPGEVEPDLAYAVSDPLIAADLEDRFGSP
jgi:hypothetical protein